LCLRELYDVYAGRNPCPSPSPFPCPDAS
jgi:hypothetical protein